MRKRQEIRRIAASIMAAVMMVTAVPFGGAAYGNEVPRGGYSKHRRYRDAYGVGFEW